MTSLGLCTLFLIERGLLVYFSGAHNLLYSLVSVCHTASHLLLRQPAAPLSLLSAVDSRHLKYTGSLSELQVRGHRY